MPKLKNYNAAAKLFVLFLTFASVISCTPKKYTVAEIRGREIPVDNKYGASDEIESFVKPYRDHINADLNAVLSYAPQTLDKSGKWQSTIGNLFADVVYWRGNPVFKQRENKEIDFILLNHGGIRSNIPQGNVTARTAYQIMPFENSLVVIELKSEQVKEIVDYIIRERKPHPISGLTFTIGKDNKPVNIAIKGKPIVDTQTYLVGTNDYLANGGDNMFFFKAGIANYNVDYKLRNILIDYFKDTDTIPVINDTRIIIE